MSSENKGSMAASVKVSLDPDRSGNFVCDGVADNVQIQAAIDYIDLITPADEGGNIYIGKGDYDIAAQLLLRDYIRFRGAGAQCMSPEHTVPRHATTMLNLANGVNDYMFEGADAANGGIWFEHLGFYGNGANQTAGGIIHSDASNILRYVYWDDCYFKDVFDEAIRWDNGLFEVYRSSLEGKQNDNATGLIYIGASASDIIIQNCEIITGPSGTLTNRGIYCAGGHVHILGNKIYSSDFNIYFSGAVRNVITGNRIDNADRTNLYLGTGSDYNTISNNLIINANDGARVDGSGIQLTNADHNVVTDNIIWDTVPNQRYGVHEAGTSDYNTVKDNEIYGWVTAAALIVGTHTKLNKAYLDYLGYTGTLGPTTSSPIGHPITSDEVVFYVGELPPLTEVQRIRIGGVALGAPVGAGGQMHLQIDLNAGARNAAYNTAAKSWQLVDHDSEEADYVANDAISWIIDDTDVGNEILALAGDDTVELFLTYEGAADPDGASNVNVRRVWLEYV